MNIMVNKHDDTDRLICGHLKKRVKVGKIFGKWKKVFVIVHKNKLKYYADDKR